METKEREYEETAPLDERETEEIREAPPPARRKSGFPVLAAQSIVCSLLLAAAFVARLMPLGDTWQEQLTRALADNRVVEWVFGDWLSPGEETSDISEASSEASSVSAESALSSGTVQAEGLLSVSARAETVEQTAALRVGQPLPTCLPLTGGVLTSGYGERIHPIRDEESFHTGWDIAAEEGTPLAAMYDATVTETGSGGSYGNYVEMQVNRTLSFLYAHCDRVLVKWGQTVKAGETVATVGNTGVSTGAHLHLEILLDGQTQDPSILLSQTAF